MRKAGRSVQEIAVYYQTSRQTVSGYLNREVKTKLTNNASMRLYYLCGEMLRTVMDVDFRNKKSASKIIQIKFLCARLAYKKILLGRIFKPFCKADACRPVEQALSRF